MIIQHMRAHALIELLATVTSSVELACTLYATTLVHKCKLFAKQKVWRRPGKCKAFIEANKK